MTELPQLRKSASSRVTGPVIRLLVRTHVTPTALTWGGFAIAVGAAVIVATGHLFVGGIVMLAGGFFDMLDGALARHTGQVTKLGAFLDSTLDRVSEAAMLLGVLVYYLFLGGSPALGILFVFLALISSLMVSYLRARGEALGMECTVGIFTRPERVIALAVGLLASRSFDNALVIALAVITLFSFIAAGQRLVHLRRQIKS